MAGSPQVAQGTLNRLRGTITVVDAPELNITAPFLGRAGISLSFEGSVTVPLPTLVGTVQSPEPYQMVTVTAALLKTQSFSDLYKRRLETDSLIGNVTVTPDASTLSPYNLSNCSILGVRELDFAGNDAGFVIMLNGFYPINSSLWDAV